MRPALPAPIGSSSRRTLPNPGDPPVRGPGSSGRPPRAPPPAPARPVSPWLSCGPRRKVARSCRADDEAETSPGASRPPSTRPQPRVGLPRDANRRSAATAYLLARPTSGRRRLANRGFRGRGLRRGDGSKVILRERLTGVRRPGSPGKVGLRPIGRCAPMVSSTTISSAHPDLSVRGPSDPRMTSHRPQRPRRRQVCPDLGLMAARRALGPVRGADVPAGEAPGPQGLRRHEGASPGPEPTLLRFAAASPPAVAPRPRMSGPGRAARPAAFPGARMPR